jgi:hypothetical protein
MATELEIWKSRADAHEQDYLHMLKRIDTLVAERDLWKQEALRWREVLGIRIQPIEDHTRSPQHHVPSHHS